MSDTVSDLQVRDDTTALRYELVSGDDVIGHATYRWQSGRVVVEHTVVDRERREQGKGSTLARGVLDDLRSRGLKVVPQCPFIASFIDENPEYRDLVDETPDDV
ncbi:GNAT family N-acetyltransferase [Actinotalea sp. AC32]|nr:GNAT family N-acetyltransferase [Actinotalea sp. AC32]